MDDEAVVIILWRSGHAVEPGRSTRHQGLRRPTFWPQRHGSTVWLRIDDTRRGGDIDLHIEAESPERATLETEIAFRLDLEDRIGEQKIDVILRRPGYAPRPIDVIALRTGLELPAVALSPTAVTR